MDPNDFVSQLSRPSHGTGITGQCRVAGDALAPRILQSSDGTVQLLDHGVSLLGACGMC